MELGLSLLGSLNVCDRPLLSVHLSVLVAEVLDLSVATALTEPE